MQHYREVAYGVVCFCVHNIHQRCYLWECFAQVVEGGLDLGLVVFSERYYNHYFTGGKHPYHKRAEETLLCAEVVEWNAVGNPV